jgi:hypothetical protein
VSLAGTTALNYHATSTASTTPTLVKSGKTTLFGIDICPKLVDTGVGCYPAYLKFFDTASPSVGTTAPTLTLCIVDEAGNQPWQNGLPSNGILFSSALSYAITANGADNDATAAQAGHIINLQYT